MTSEIEASIRRLEYGHQFRRRVLRDAAERVAALEQDTFLLRKTARFGVPCLGSVLFAVTRPDATPIVGAAVVVKTSGGVIVFVGETNLEGVLLATGLRGGSYTATASRDSSGLTPKTVNFTVACAETTYIAIELGETVSCAACGRDLPASLSVTDSYFDSIYHFVAGTTESLSHSTGSIYTGSKTIKTRILVGDPPEGKERHIDYTFDCSTNSLRVQLTEFSLDSTLGLTGPCNPLGIEATMSLTGSFWKNVYTSITGGDAITTTFAVSES